MRPRWRALGHHVLVGETQGPWCKARAVAAALPFATGDLLVIADADCWSPGIDAALEAVRDGAPWAMPHGRVHRLTPDATAQVLAGVAPHPRMPVTQRPYQGWPGGGIVVVRRDVYEQAPLDPRFTGWGGEDESWAHALTTLAGPPWRGRAPLWHLWHPPQDRMSRRWGSPEARELAGRYRKAARSPAAMRALVDEAGKEIFT
ncbi:glycosyltransferase family protein [Marinitenerispora sediminis]|uniref:Galactosyltransferase C-terminal domain-containing protein n=1 Tax=Marinitenerispora sediminis TaxID=1931232 RepID=A0A368T6I5_9ACTN|nr:hypothetical protein [Marinitenerispora sediminis]RCV53458.1 hypothetical protein DEF23_17415 [Marinitenerispora sediminis]RCV59286.1 hypothetical protein DEF24_09955 [Marinitenerispora sediminis]